MAADLYTNADGANYQAQAVLAYIRRIAGIEDSWNATRGCYEAEPKVARWENCREQGYVISLRSKHYGRQINIAFFEHRNSDAICAVEFELMTLNSPTIDSIPKSHPYCNSKYAVSHSVSVGRAEEMADWINQRLVDFWNATKSEAA